MGRSDAPLRLAADRGGPGAWIALRPIDERSVEGITEGATTWFSGVAPDVDRAIVRGDGAIEELRVLRSPRAPHRARWAIERGPAIALLRVREGRVEALDRAGAVLVRTEPAWAVDAEGRVFDVAVALADDGRELDVDAPRAGVAYPLIVDPTWSLAPDDSLTRSVHVAARLPSGKILVAGGSWTPDTLSVAALYDPRVESWSNTAPMHARRAYFCATALTDGRVLVAGGSPIDSDSTTIPGASSTAELYDEATHGWKDTSDMATPRRRHACVRLGDGRVLVMGGSLADGTALSTAELWDPATGAWTQAHAASRAFDRAHATKLGDGRVLLTSFGKAEIYEPTNDTWTPADASSGALPTLAELTTLPSGDALMVGDGAPNAALFDAKANAWTALAGLAKGRSGTSLQVLPDGSALVAGGYVPSADDTLSTADRFEPKTRTFAALEPMHYPRVGALPMLLDDGRVLLIGGLARNGAIRNEYFDAANGTPCSRDDVCGSGHCIDGRCCATACDGACQACDLKGKEGTCSPLDGAPRASHPSCAPYAACEAGACASGCAVDAECSAGNVCLTELGRCGPEKGLCDGRATIHDPRGKNPDVSCAPYACTPAGACTTTCTTGDDCAPGALCDPASHACVPAPSAAPSDGGGCATGHGRAGLSGAVGALVALGWLSRRRRRAKWTGLGVGLLIALSTARAGATSWRPIALAEESQRLDATLTPLEDGRLLLVGGVAAEPLSIAEIYDPQARSWSETGPTRSGRSGHVAVRLADGRVFVAGGFVSVLQPGETDPYPHELSTAEIYDPATATWTATAGSMSVRRAKLSGALLGDGRVLVVGGEDAFSKTGEVFDPATGGFATVTFAYGHSLGSVASLPDGTAIVLGGEGGKHTEIFDPKTNALRAGPDALFAHRSAPALVLPDGRVFFYGGVPRAAELYDPAKGAFVKLADSSFASAYHSATLMGDGRVLVLGGANPGVEAYARAEVFDVDGPTKRVVPAPDAPRFGHVAAPLPDGRVLVLGGIGMVDDSAPSFGLPVVYAQLEGARCAADEACASGHCVDGVCCATACGDACRACDVAGHRGTCTAIDGPPRAGHATCAPYGLCALGGCLAACAGDGDCDDEHVCALASSSCVAPSATCEADGRSVRDTVTGATKDCAPYRCASNGTCRVRCETSDDCVASASCDRGVCTGGEVATDAGGCGVEPGHAGPLQPAALLGLGLSFAAASRRALRASRGGGEP